MGARVLDLYAGTGAIGIEAMSRGAAHITFVEADHSACQILHENLGRCRGASDLHVCRSRVEQFLGHAPSWRGPYDIVFADPPYALTLDFMQLLDLLAPSWPHSPRRGHRRTRSKDDTPVTCGHITLPSALRVWRHMLEPVSPGQKGSPFVMKIGVYPGTFDPVTHGHTDIVTRSLRIFEKVIVAIAPNPGKHPLFTLEERLEMVRLVTKDIANVEVTAFNGLLVDFVRHSGAHAVLRGLRAISDFEHEFQMALINRKLAESVETVFLMPSEEYSYLSSTIIKDVAAHGGSLKEIFTPRRGTSSRRTDPGAKTMKLAARAARVVPSPTLSITATAKAMAAQGIDVVDFASANPTSIRRNRSKPRQKPPSARDSRNIRLRRASMNCGPRSRTN